MIQPKSEVLAPIVTTVIPTYRRPALVARAIESVLRQTAGQARVAVYDNASGDETGAVVTAIAQADPRVRYQPQAKNLGPFENFRAGLAGVTTPYFSLLSDDDLVLPGFYETALRALDAHPEALFAVTRVLQVDRKGHLIKVEGSAWPPGLYDPPRGLLEMVRLGYITWTGTLFRREVVERSGGFDPETAVAFDVDFALRVAARCPFVICEQVGGVYVTETSALSLDATLRAWEKIIDNIGRESALSASQRTQAQEAVRRQLGALVYRIGRAAARRGDIGEARTAATVLRVRFADDRGARVIEATAELCRRVALIPPLLGFALQGYRGARSTWLRARLGPGDRHFLQTAGVG